MQYASHCSIIAQTTKKKKKKRIGGMGGGSIETVSRRRSLSRERSRGSGDGTMVTFSRSGSLSSKQGEEESSPSSPQSDLPNPSFSNTLSNMNDELLDISGTMRSKIYSEIMQGYARLRQATVSTLEERKNEILRYYPGAWIEEVGGLTLSNYDIPSTTTLLLIGPRGSGKSSLVNRISRVFEASKFSADRAQVSYGLSVGDGTCFLQEYMIPRGSTSLCVYDTRSLSQNSSENFKLLRRWMIEGVRHGQMVVRKDDLDLLVAMKEKARDIHHSITEKRMVNFVIFVVDGCSVKECMASKDSKQYTSMLAKAFSCPYLSFKDDKPVVIVTHGDELTLSERACVRIHLGELLGVPPDRQIFDIPDASDLATELTIVDMLHYSLQHADRNLPMRKKTLQDKGLRICIMLMIQALLGAVVIKNSIQHCSEAHVDWTSIRHLWLG